MLPSRLDLVTLATSVTRTSTDRGAGTWRSNTVTTSITSIKDTGMRPTAITGTSTRPSRALRPWSGRRYSPAPMSVGQLVGVLASLIAGVLFAGIAVYQLRRPGRWLGRPVLLYMNLSHSALTDWGIKHVSIQDDYTVLDVGCGGGRTVKKLAAIAPRGKVFGVDYARGSVAASRAANSKLIASGQVEIKEASVSQLPFADSTFDAVTAIETQYYWPNPVEDMREIKRVLKPGGCLLVVAESYKRRKDADAHDAAAMSLLRAKMLSVDDEERLFAVAGYTDIQTWEESSRGWMCAAGRKPA